MLRVIFFIFWGIYGLSAYASPCKLLAAPDGRYHYLQNREERTVSAYVYWKQASTLVQTLEGLYEYGVCTPWAQNCLNGICQGVPECEIRQKGGLWALFREGRPFSPWISDAEGGREYLADIFSIYKSGHICYGPNESTTSMQTPPALNPPPALTGNSTSFPTPAATPDSPIALPLGEKNDATKAPTSAPATIQNPEAQALQSAISQADMGPETVGGNDEGASGGIPTIELMAPVQGEVSGDIPGTAPEKATGDLDEVDEEGGEIPAQAFEE